MSPQQAGERDAPRTRRPWPERRGSFRGPTSPIRRPSPDAVLRTHVFDAADLRRALTRIAHEIVERNHGADDVVLVGLYTRGVALARRIAAAIATFEGGRAGRSARSTSRSTATTSGCGRSRRSGRPRCPTSRARSSCSSTTCCSPGRTARAALDALHELGRPRAVQLAVLRRPRPPRAAVARPTTSARTCRPGRPRTCVCASPRSSGDDGVDLWGSRPERSAVKHLLVEIVDDLGGRAERRHRVDARPDRLVPRGDPTRHPEGPRAARQDGRVAVLRGLHPHAALVRDRGEAPRRPTR